MMSYRLILIAFFLSSLTVVSQTPPVANDDYHYFTTTNQSILPLENDEVTGQGIITDVTGSPNAIINFTDELVDYFPTELPPYLTEVLTYTITDDTGLEASANIFVDMSVFAPQLVDDIVMVQWEECNNFNISFNDQIMFSPFEIIPISVPPEITVDVFSNGQITICTDLAEFALFQFWYTIANADTAQVTVELIPPNFPDAVNDTTQCLYNTFVIVDVLGNDNFDYEPDIVDFSQGSNGAVTLSLDNRLIYTPIENFSGLDTFQYALLNMTTAEFDVANVFVDVGEPVGLEQNERPSWFIDSINRTLTVSSNQINELAVYSIDGKLVYQKQFDSFSSKHIPLTSLTAGLYILRINDQSFKLQLY